MNDIAQEEELNLDLIQVGDTLTIDGDDGPFTFTCIARETAGPVGIFQATEGDGLHMTIQLLGMVAWDTAGSLSAILEPHVLKSEYGKLLVLTTSKDATGSFETYCVSSYTHTRL